MVVTIDIPDVCERDIDLLLLEEFVASPDFRWWFLSQIGADEDAVLLKARRSVKTSNGETDLDLQLSCAQGSVRVLIENKVDAEFQPDQSQRYAERARDHMQSGQYCEVVTVLLAPEVYFGDEAETFGFDAKVTYESILSWFMAADHLGGRQEYKLALLRGAIDRGQRGWELVSDPGVTGFWHSYWRFAEQFAPELAMPVPNEAIPAGSSFVRFRPAALPPSVSLLHKVGHGHVDLQFAGMGNKLAEMEHQYRAHMLPDMRIEKAAQSAVIRVRVDPIDMASARFSDCEATIRRALEAAVGLVRWYGEVATGGNVSSQRSKDV